MCSLIRLTTWRDFNIDLFFFVIVLYSPPKETIALKRTVAVQHVRRRRYSLTDKCCVTCSHKSRESMMLGRKICPSTPHNCARYLNIVLNNVSVPDLVLWKQAVGKSFWFHILTASVLTQPSAR
jgi:hypothetical protein